MATDDPTATKAMPNVLADRHPPCAGGGPSTVVARRAGGIGVASRPTERSGTPESRTQLEELRIGRVGDGAGWQGGHPDAQDPFASRMVCAGAPRGGRECVTC